MVLHVIRRRKAGCNAIRYWARMIEVATPDIAGMRRGPTHPGGRIPRRAAVGPCSDVGSLSNAREFAPTAKRSVEPG